MIMIMTVLRMVVQGWTLIMLGPFLDLWVTKAWILGYTWSSAATLALAMSCSLAIGVNISQFACLGVQAAHTPPRPPDSTTTPSSGSP